MGKKHSGPRSQEDLNEWLNVGRYSVEAEPVPGPPTLFFKAIVASRRVVDGVMERLGEPAWLRNALLFLDRFVKKHNFSNDSATNVAIYCVVITSISIVASVIVALCLDYFCCGGRRRG